MDIPENDPTRVLARMLRKPDGTWIEQLLIAHLHNVAALCETFAARFKAAELLFIAGLWHDLGKYSKEFQAYLRDRSGYEREMASEEDPDGRSASGRVDHSTAGAIQAMQALGPIGIVIAHLIAAHHAGLYDADDLRRRLLKSELLTAALAGGIPEAVLSPTIPLLKHLDIPGGAITPGALALWLRMLFSCLVDADRLDSAHASEPEQADLRKQPEINAYLSIYDDHMKTLAERAIPSLVNQIRADVLKGCLERSELAPGLFSLTVPTGGGKTLASLGFALRHAQHWKKRRVIYVIPYTSIIEQTSDIFRRVFEKLGEDAILEHHSSTDPDKETQRTRLATENWDAPLIVTTSVQFFESLFAAKPSRCRKVHNIADSVVILDEAQLLPTDFLQPILDVLNLLAKHYGVSVVICTATQPVLSSWRLADGKGLRGLDKDAVRELTDDPIELHRQLERVEVHIPADLQTRQTWEEISTQIRSHDDVLAIVNRRKDARDLYRLMPTGTFHLSGMMCAAHRTHVIDEIKARLTLKRDGQLHEAIRIVSTQLIECGVDIGLSTVYRALAGLDSIAQAAGRCNREGLLTDSQGRLVKGQVHVFLSPERSPRGLLRKGEDSAVGVLHAHRGGMCEIDLDMYKAYFQRFYSQCEMDSKEICADLDPAKFDAGHLNLRSASDKFRLINEEDNGYASIYVPYWPRHLPNPRWTNEENLSSVGREESDKSTLLSWFSMLRSRGPERWLMRKLQRYSISIPSHLFNTMRTRGDLEELYEGMFLLQSEAQYHPQLGLTADELSIEASIF